MSCFRILSMVSIALLSIGATSASAQTTKNADQPKPAVFVNPSEAERPPVMNTSDPVNPMACAMLSVLSEQLPNAGQPPKPAVAVSAAEFETPVPAVQPDGQAG